MIYGNVVRQYENSKVSCNTVNESNAILEVLTNERNSYRSLIENTSLPNDQRELLEAKYEVIQESITIAIIVAVIAAVGALIVLITKVMGSTSSVSGKVEQKKKSDTKETLSVLDDCLDELSKNIESAFSNLYQPENDNEKYRKVADDLGLDIDTMSDTEFRNFTKNVDKGMYDQNNNAGYDSDEETTRNYKEKFGKKDYSNHQNKSWSDVWNDTSDDSSQTFINNTVQNKKSMSKKDMIGKVKNNSSNYQKSREEIRILKNDIKNYRIKDNKTESFKLFLDKFVELCKSSFSKEFPGFYCGTLADNINEECIRELNDETLMAANDFKEAISTAYKDMGDGVHQFDKVENMEQNSQNITQRLKNGAANIVFKSGFLQMFKNERNIKEYDALSLLFYYYDSRSSYYYFSKQDGDNMTDYANYLIENDEIGTYYNNQFAKKNANKVLTTLKNDLKNSNVP